MRLYLFVLLTSSILSFCNNYSQENIITNLTSKLDSLLLKNRIEEFKSSYNLIDLSILKQKTEMFDFYQIVIDKMERLNNTTQSKIAQYIKTYSNQSIVFSLENAGPKSHFAFDNFLQFLTEKDTINAVKQINIALSFRDRYIKDKKAIILGYYRKAEYYCDIDKPDSASFMLTKYSTEVNSFKPLSTIKDTLIIRYRSLDDKIQQKYFKFKQMQNPIMTERFQINYSFSINTSQQIKNKYWPYKEYGGNRTINSLTNGLNSFLSIDHTIALGYFFNPKLNTIVEFNFGGLYYSSPAIKEEFVSKEKYSAKNKTVNIVANYFLSDHLGLRPYFGMGLGYSEFNLKIEKQISYRYDPGSSNLLYIVNYNEKGYGTSLFLFRFGIDYLLVDPKISFGISTNYMYMLKDVFFINQNVYKFSLAVGYRF